MVSSSCLKISTNISSKIPQKIQSNMRIYKLCNTRIIVGSCMLAVSSQKQRRIVKCMFEIVFEKQQLYHHTFIGNN